ncbi:hypothetical protein [Streptomyces sp. NPDC088733]
MEGSGLRDCFDSLDIRHVRWHERVDADYPPLTREVNLSMQSLTTEP